MKKLIILIVTAITMFLWTQTAFATGSATIYVSPSSQTVTKGNTFSVSIRINSSTDRVDTVSAQLNFSASKVQYLSYSASGSGFTSEFSANHSSSYFSTTRTKLGGYTTGDKLIASVSFKALASGSTSMSLSSTSSAYSGSYLSTSASGATVTISNPSSSSSGGSSSSGSSTSGGTSTGSGDTSSSTSSKTDTTAPKIDGNPTFTPDYGNIKASFKTSEDAKALIRYGTSSRDKQTAQTSLAKTQEIIIGKDAPLVPGTKYSFVIELSDKAGNKSTSKVYTVSTKGYAVQLTIVDSKGNPVTNQDVTLHSDPMQAKTDSKGIVTFNDVAPGAHTITFVIDGVTINQSLTVANDLNLSGSREGSGSNEQKLAIKLPFALNEAAVAKSGSTGLAVLLLVGASGLLLGVALTIGRNQIIAGLKRHAINFHEWHKKKLDTAGTGDSNSNNQPTVITPKNITKT